MADFSFHPWEEELQHKGYQWIAGVDEVGRGCLAGPVLAACVVMPHQEKIPGIRDSKKLTPQKREALYPLILGQCLAFGVGQIEAPEIDHINILEATKKAMAQAVMALGQAPDCLMIDGKIQLPLSCEQRGIVGGDDVCYSIAAASIIAKVTRDRLMVKLAEEYPGYEFERHKGYGTSVHRDAIKKLGITRQHRRSFRGVAEYS
jgi:ribonuclease HII